MSHWNRRQWLCATGAAAATVLVSARSAQAAAVVRETNKNGHLLMTYGHRRPPFGNQARVSGDHGRTWSEPLIISGDGASQDLGYPSTVELDDGSLVTVWYETLAGSPRAVLRQASWTLAGI